MPKPLTVLLVIVLFIPVVRWTAKVMVRNQTIRRLCE